MSFHTQVNTFVLYGTLAERPDINLPGIKGGDLYLAHDLGKLYVARFNAIRMWVEVTGGSGTGFPLTSDGDAAGFKIVDLGAPTAPGDATNKAYVDAQVAASGDGFPLDANGDAAGFKIFNLGAPTNPADAATKAYVDSVVSGDGFPLTANGDAAGFKIINLGAPALGGDATNKTYVDGVVGALDALVVHKAGTETITGDKTFTGKDSYNDGTSVLTNAKGVNFTANRAQTAYYLTADNLTITLASTDPDGTTYEFWSITGNPPMITFAPNGGLLINGGATENVNRRYAAQVVRKINGQWYAGR